MLLCSRNQHNICKAISLQLKKKLAYLDLSLEYHYPLVLTLFLLISGPESAEFLSWRLWNLRGKRERTYVYLWLIHVNVWWKPNNIVK